MDININWKLEEGKKIFFLSSSIQSTMCTVCWTSNNDDTKIPLVLSWNRNELYLRMNEQEKYIYNK